jgi:fructose-specific phosphotransferase system component IIB
MSIQLGDLLPLDKHDAELVIVIPSSTSVIDDSFVNETPEVKISNKKAIERKDREIQRLATELAHLKQQLADLRERINSEAESQDC